MINDELREELRFLDKHPSNDPQALEHVVNNTPELLRVYDKYVLGEYNEGKELAFFYCENTYGAIIDSIAEEFCKQPADELAARLLRQDIGRERRAYAARRFFLGICKVFHEEWFDKNKQYDGSDVAIKAFELLEQMILRSVRNKEKVKEEIKK